MSLKQRTNYICCDTWISVCTRISFVLQTWKKNVIYSGVLLAIHVELTALLFPFPMELIPITVVERPIAESFQLWLRTRAAYWWWAFSISKKALLINEFCIEFVALRILIDSNSVKNSVRETVPASKIILSILNKYLLKNALTLLSNLKGLSISYTFQEMKYLF